MLPFVATQQLDSIMAKTFPIKLNLEKNYNWSSSIFFSMLKMSNSIFKISNEEIEENWASIFSDREVIGYIWKKYPLVIIISDYLEIFIREVENHSEVIIIPVESLQEKQFIIDKELLCDLHFEGNDKLVSAEDLWFNTM